MATLTIQIEDAGLQDGLERLAKAGGAALREGLTRLGREIREQTEDRFDEGQSPDGNPWPASIRAAAEGGVTLVDSGHLAKSFTMRVSDDGVEVGTDLAYANTHQFGAVIKPKNGKALAFNLPGGGFALVKKVTIPARPFLGVGAADIPVLQGVLERWLREVALQGAKP